MSGLVKDGRKLSAVHYTICSASNQIQILLHSRLWDSFVSSIALTGNGYLELTRNKQKDVAGLWFLNPASVQPIRQADGSIAYRTSEGLAPGNFKLLQAADVIHVPWHSLNGVTGISPIAQARNAIANSIAMDKFNGRFFANNATPSGILTLPTGMKVKSEDKPKMRKDWEDQQLGGNQHRINILDQGATFTPITISQADSQFLESKNYTRQEICGLFRIHPSQIGDTARVAGETYAAQQLTFLNDCLRPWLNRIQQELTRKLLPKSQALTSKYSISHDVSDRLKMDLKSQMEAFATARQWGLITANEARMELGLNPGGAECDVYLTPLNMVDAKKLLLPEVAPTQVVENE